MYSNERILIKKKKCIVMREYPKEGITINIEHILLG